MRIGVVGTSYWAERVHGAAAAASPDWELAVVYGRSAEKAAALAGSFGCAATTDYDDLLERVDAVGFAVPPDVQAPLAVRAARAGKHLLLEKPLALDVPAAEELVAAVTTAGVANLVFFTRLWAPEMRAWLDGVREQGGWESGRYEHLARLPAEFLKASPWRQEHGALWDIGPHGLSSLEQVLGPVTDVTALQGARDHVHLVLRHADGSTSSAELSLTAPEGASRMSVRFGGARGDALADETTVAFTPLEAAAAALAELAEQVRSGRRGGVDAAYGRHVVRVLAAAQRSLGSRCVEHV